MCVCVPGEDDRSVCVCVCVRTGGLAVLYLVSRQVCVCVRECAYECVRVRACAYRGTRSVPGEQTDQLAHLLPHPRGAPAQVVLEQLADQALQHQDVADGAVGGERAQQRDAVARHGRGAAVALGGGGVAAAQHGQRAVLAGGEGGRGRAAGRLGGGFALLQVVLQQLLTRRRTFWKEGDEDGYQRALYPILLLYCIRATDPRDSLCF